ncbi:MAG: 3-phosphoshikimate 1-carboxyvinyltransferase [Balneolaceae bacterium]|nr:MAG: 3-phosphoshikimate 1-carboxyvinyltransferase [Balneolaceae bacterium]
MIQQIKPVNVLNGTITPPPDKSISHRSAMFAAISDGLSVIRNYSAAADPQSTLACLKQLGVRIESDENGVTIRGVGRDGLQIPGEPLDCGNSGTTMRLLGGIVAGAGITCELIGDESLSSRTMKRIIDPLNALGCIIKGKNGDFAPLLVSGHSGLRGMRFPLPIASAQLKSAVLLAGLFSEEPVEVIEQVLSRDHTERLLDLKSEPYGTGKIIRSSRGDILPAQNYTVPGDFSAAAFWLVSGTIHNNASLIIKHTGMNPSRIAALRILEEMGASIITENPRMEGKEPVADVRIEPAELKAIDLNPAFIPNCIDELPVLMVAMCFAEGTSNITGAGELRHKETDRLSAMAEILTLSGAAVELKNDGITIHGKKDFIPKAAVFPSYHDHRMAMAAAVLATKSQEVSAIMDAECTAISYPEFWNHLEQISR